MTATIGITGFNSGELSPLISARTDLEKYSAGCRQLQNMLPSMYGAAIRRPGTEYIATAKNSPQGVRLIPFIYSSEIAYMCEFGDQYIRFYYSGAQLTDGAGAIVEVATPYLVAHLPQLQYRQIGDVLWLVHPSYAPRKLSRTSATAFALATITFAGGPFMVRNDIAEDDDVTLTSSVTTAAATGTLTASAAMFESKHIEAYFQLIHTKKDVSVSIAATGTGASDALAVEGTFTFTTHGTWSATVLLERSEDSGSTWDTYRTYVGTADTNISFPASRIKTASNTASTSAPSPAAR